MLRALRTCLVALALVVGGVGCATDPDEHPTGDTEPTDLRDRGGWEGSNCMGADYGITLLDDAGRLVEVRQSTAIGVIADAVRLAYAVNELGGVEVELEGLDRFLAVGLRNWMHKMGEVLLPDEDWIASYDPDNDEYGRGHYDVAGLGPACEQLPSSLSPPVARTLAMFLYALSQLASCPDAQAAEADGNFVAVDVRLQATVDLAAQLPAAPPAPTVQELVATHGARPVPAGASPDPTMTCILWDVALPLEPVVTVLDPTPDAPRPPTTDVSFRAAPPPRCLLEARVESIVTTVARHHPTFAPGPAGEPVAFAPEAVLRSTAALGQAAAVRHFLRDNHVGAVTRIESFTTCDLPWFAPYGAATDPCPASLARLHVAGATVERAPAPLPPELELALAPIFSTRRVSDAIVVILPFDTAPRCLAECPPERPAPEGDACE